MVSCYLYTVVDEYNALAGGMTHDWTNEECKSGSQYERTCSAPVLCALYGARAAVLTVHEHIL